MSKLYIHYGSKKFDKKKVTCEKSGFTIPSKPKYGLWASPVDTNWGWREWCAEERFRECDEEDSFMFSLTENAKILNIFSEDDILPYIIRKEGSSFWTNWMGRPLKTSIIDGIDWGKIISDGYDAVELYNSIGLHDTVFNSWDCDSIVILNPDIVVERKKNND